MKKQEKISYKAKSRQISVGEGDFCRTKIKNLRIKNARRQKLKTKFRKDLKK
jgi:hypothetical protein